MSCTVHYTVLYRSYKFRASALTLRLCFCCFKDNHSTVITLEVFSLQRDLLSRFSQGIDLYTSAKFRAFHTYLNNSACILHHFPVLTCTYLILNE